MAPIWMVFASNFKSWISPRMRKELAPQLIRVWDGIHSNWLASHISDRVQSVKASTGLMAVVGFDVAAQDIPEQNIRSGTVLIRSDTLEICPSAKECISCGWYSDGGFTLLGEHAQFYCNACFKEFERERRARVAADHRSRGLCDHYDDDGGFCEEAASNGESTCWLHRYD